MKNHLTPLRELEVKEPADSIALEVRDALTGHVATADRAVGGWYVSRTTPFTWWPTKDDAIQGLARYLRRTFKPKIRPVLPPPGTELEYHRDIKPHALALSRANYDALRDILKSLGAATGAELKPDQLEEALKRINDALDREQLV
jgi:hypothetical protein